MTNGEKAKDWGLYEKAVKVYPDDWCKKRNITPSDVVHSARMGYQTGALEMAEWKDQQFKEYLEKKREEYMSQRDDANMWAEQWAVFHALTCTMHNIINELFGE